MKLRLLALTAILFLGYAPNQVLAESSVSLQDEDGGFPVITAGPQLGGGGVAGFTIRGDAVPNFSVGVSVLYRPTIISGTDNDDGTYTGVMVPVDLVLWLAEESGEAKGPLRHGVLFTAGYNFSPYPETMVAIAYEFERFKNRDHIFNASVGVGLLTTYNLPGDAEEMPPNIIYTRFAWRWGQ